LGGDHSYDKGIATVTWTERDKKGENREKGRREKRVVK